MTLGNLEQRMVFDQSGSLDAISANGEKEKIRAKVATLKLETTQSINGVAQIEKTNAKVEKKKDEEHKPAFLETDPFVSINIYVCFIKSAFAKM
jgi:hypothetical protein